MKGILKYLGILVTVFIIMIVILDFNNDIGIYKVNIEKETRLSQKIPTDWAVYKSETESIESMIFYNNIAKNHRFSNYVNRKGLFFGYFFRGGGSLRTTLYNVVRFQVEGLMRQYICLIIRMRFVR